MKGYDEMKQIIPFKKELLFKTKVSEITSISLEHTLTLKNEDLISGEFHITGDYKMTEGSINREKFYFTLPFDIALDSRYDMSSIIIDIDNFYYEVINNEALQVNIDVYVEGEKIEEPLPELSQTNPSEEEILPSVEETTIERESIEKTENQNLDSLEERGMKEEEDIKINNCVLNDESEPKEESIDEEKAVLEAKTDILREDEVLDETIEFTPPIMTSLEEEKKVEINHNNEFNIFENIDNSDTYVTYHVYIVKDTDNIDNITQKYNVTKEDVALYNNLEEIKPGMKLIIPNTNE